jgi:sugar transferase (PEP-CTERM system associated)
MVALDVAAMACAWPLALALTGFPVPDAGLAGAALLLYPAANLVLFYALGLYQRDVLLDARKALGRIPLAVVLGALIASGTVALLDPAYGSVHGPARLFALAVAGFLAGGIAARGVLSSLRRRGFLRRRLLVIGAGPRAWDLVWMLRKEGGTLNYEIAFVHDPSLGEVDPRLADGSAGRVITAGNQGILGVAREFGADQIVVAPDERRGMDLQALLECKVAGFPVQQYLTFVEQEIRRVDLKRMELSWLLYSEGFSFGILDQTLKRALDVVVSTLLLLASSPFLLAAMAAVKLDDGGPVLYRQERVTRDGRPFRITKLRTMRVDAEAGGAVWAASADSRITRIGTFLRRTRLDELPQLFDVLRGDMSLVGPRPERPQFVQMLANQIPLYQERHVVKAGLTGWAQVNYPYGASTDDARSKLSYDLYYVKNFSVLFDLLIILQTIRVVLWPSGVR